VTLPARGAVGIAAAAAIAAGVCALAARAESPAATAAATTAPASASKPAPPAPPLSFAVLSDLHLPAAKSDRPPAAAAHMIDQLVAKHPRFVVVTGDFTNGNLGDKPGQTRYRAHAWRAVRNLLEPLRTAGIPVLPIAGNHDAYLAGQRRLYADAFSDLDSWAAPLTIVGHRQPASGDPALDAAPFSYAVDVDGVHLALGHIVDQHVTPALGAWLADDLAHAKSARVRLVFGHVPISSVMATPNRDFVRALGAILTAGAADAYIAGHEHLTWDELIALPGGATLRQILVGTATGRYDYGPSAASMKRAGCVRRGAREACKLPFGGTPFELRRGEGGKWIQDQAATLTMVTIDGTAITATPIGIDGRGDLVPFGPTP
jgi:hypothetical protein